MGRPPPRAVHGMTAVIRPHDPRRQQLEALAGIAIEGIVDLDGVERNDGACVHGAIRMPFAG